MAILPRVNGHNPWPTAVGAGLVVWNIVHWNKPEKHVSRAAAKHPFITLLVMGWYGDHWLREWAAEHVRSLLHDRQLRFALNGRGSKHGGNGSFSRRKTSVR